MRISRLRDKLLLGFAGISLATMLISMLAASWVISRQYAEQTATLLASASHIIEGNLALRKAELATASRQLAAEKNLGYTIWYLGRYAADSQERATFASAYRKLASEAQRAGGIARASSTALYDARGALVAYAISSGTPGHLGYVEHTRPLALKAADSTTSEAATPEVFHAANAPPPLPLVLDAGLGTQESVRYVFDHGTLAIQVAEPIIGEAFDPRTGARQVRRLGAVIMTRAIERSIVNHFAGLAGARINIFNGDGYSTGDLPQYGKIERRGTTSSGPDMAFDQVTVGGRNYYQSLIPLENGGARVGSIAVLYSMEMVHSSARAMMWTLAAIATVSLAVIIMFAWYTASSISRPLSALSRMFRNVATSRSAAIGDDELAQITSDSTRPDELADLARNFIAMSEAVEQKMRQINEINASLEQKVRERTSALVASERESRTMIENSPDTIARYDRECRRVYANPAFGALTPGGVAALLGKRPSEMPGGENAERYEAAIRRVFETGEDTQFELKWPETGGVEICNHIRLTAERDLSGKIVTVLGIGRDISELNAYRSELKRRDAEKTRFLAAAGHDMRQPLAAANLFIDALRTSGITPGQERIVQSLEQAMSTFKGLLDTLLDISKLDAGILNPEIGPVNVADLCGWLDQNFAPLATRKGLAFKLHFPMPGPLVIRSDAGLLRSVLMNLVSNALKFTHAGGILISVRKRGNTVLFQVWDTGVGVDAQHISHIFDEFYQVDNPQRDRSAGLGLGLAIVKRSLALLGSRIEVRSQPGRGSVFGFYLPLGDARAGAGEPAQRPALPNGAFSDMRAQVHGKTFAVVEDDKLVGRAIVAALGTLGATVHYFHRAEDALQHAGIDKCDYVIADYMLGGPINGVEFLNRLHEQLGREIRAVILTGDTSPAFIQTAESCRWPVLHKPVSLEHLLPALVGT